ncbi:MAG: hypothetical protein INQ03_23815 [Candidatus Heimdallarchaeota archaeon]|nr:hypothetical protein [Candidatus Heimdallarchaeota archaeon]
MNISIWKFQDNDLIFVDNYLFYKIGELVHVFNNTTKEYSILEDYGAFIDHMVNVNKISHQEIVDHMARKLLDMVTNDISETYILEEMPTPELINQYMIEIVEVLA